MSADPLLARLECLELDVATLRCEVEELRRLARTLICVEEEQ